jgi:ribose-phosphate pyrophosphokinase
MKTEKPIIFALPGNESLAENLCEKLSAEQGKATIRNFPDGETYVRIHSDVQDKKVILACTLYQPDSKILPLYFLAKTAKDLGAESVCLMAPYLAYMRQDKQFNPGEGITSDYFGDLISQFVDSLITLDPHLHRRSSLSEVYSIPSQVVHAAHHISKWIKTNIEKPVLIGPDSESKQWVSEVAKDADAPFIVLQKTRRGDKDVEVSVPEVDKFKYHTPVLVDDIISTARTMIAAVNHLKNAGMKAPVCIGVHAVFAENAYHDLKDAGTQEIITCNTIPHESNAIWIDDLLVNAYNTLPKAQ